MDLILDGVLTESKRPKKRSRRLPEYELPKNSHNILHSIQMICIQAISEADDTSYVRVSFTGGEPYMDAYGKPFVKRNIVEKKYGRGLMFLINMCMGIYTTSTKHIVDTRDKRGIIFSTLTLENALVIGSFDSNDTLIKHYKFKISYSFKGVYYDKTETIRYEDQDLYQKALELLKIYIPFLNR